MQPSNSTKCVLKRNENIHTKTYTCYCSQKHCRHHPKLEMIQMSITAEYINTSGTSIQWNTTEACCHADKPQKHYAK